MIEKTIKSQSGDAGTTEWLPYYQPLTNTNTHKCTLKDLSKENKEIKLPEYLSIHIRISESHVPFKQVSCKCYIT